ncbi:hypothetical protein F4774DRAFT_366536 [Daldinia eschscholtzii]|nr:hypothetical protein F4774DRAFT_366536 [Daldinia eschscholtzii]
MTMQPRKYPVLLPSSTLPQEGESSKSGQRRQRPGACTACRRRKIKCDGMRPRCTTCVKRGMPSCIYIDKAKVGPEAMELLELLKSLPINEAFALLGALREEENPAIVLSGLKDDSLDDHTVPLGLDTRGPIPPRSMLELELMANNSKAYHALRRISPAALAKSDLLRQIRPSMKDYHINSPPPTGTTLEGRHFPLLIKPGEEVSYCDERLRNLQVGFWTDIAVSNDFAARVIDIYITTDHPLLGLFSADLFITDLINCRDKFCSRFLFHSLMYLGCQMYSAFDKDAMQFANDFFKEAEKLWKGEQDSCTAVAGAILLSLSLIGNSRDHAVLSYAKKALQMSRNLGLFDAAEAIASKAKEMSEDDMISCCYAAWGTFNWNVLVSFFYRQPGAESPSLAPELPIPGETILERGIEGILEGKSVDEDPQKMIFPVLCRFWQIIRGAGWIYTPAEGSPPKAFRIALAEHTFRELIAWAESLPSPLLRGEGRSHHVTVIHIWLHCAILDVFRPFTGKPEGERPRLTTFLARDGSPDTAYAASVGQLKNLIVEYRSNYVASTYSILWHTGLLYLANAMLKDTGDPEWRVYLLLCLYGYENLSRPYLISEVIAQGLLSMSLKETDMAGSEAQKIINEVKEGRLAGTDKGHDDEPRATFMVDLDLALKKPEEASAENLAAEFDNLALFREFLNEEETGV